MSSISNLQAALNTRAQRNAADMDAYGSYRPQNVGGPVPDIGWDAFWGQMDHQAEEAKAEGRNYKVNFGSLQGLRTALAGR